MEMVAGSSRVFLKRRISTSSSDESGHLKVRRQRYFYVLASESEKETEGSESVYSIQAKSTDLVKDTSDTSTKSSNMFQFEVASTSEGDNPHPFPSNGDTSSSPEDIKKNDFPLRSKSDDFDCDPFADGSSLSSSEAIYEFRMAEFWTCVHCKQPTENPMFRYCEKCFKVKKNFFPPRPKGKKKKKYKHHGRRMKHQKGDSGVGSSFTDTTQKSIPSLLSQGDSGVGSSFTDTTQKSIPSLLSQGDSGVGSSFTDTTQKSIPSLFSQVDSGVGSSFTDTTQKSIPLLFSQGDSGVSSSFTDTTQKSIPSLFSPSLVASQSQESIPPDSQEQGEPSSRKSVKICKSCFQYPQNGGFIHGNIIHVHSCYRCSIKIVKQTGKCPVCNIRVKQVSRVVNY